jgi:hypothetical protein
MRTRIHHVRWMPLAIIVGGAALGVIVLAQTSSHPSSARRTEAKASRPKESTIQLALATVAPRKPLDYYIGGVRADLFTAPQPQAPPAPKPEPAKTEPPKPTTPPAVVDPFADYAYTGTVSLDGRKMALIENTKTKEGQYLSEGDTFMGGTIQQINERSLTIMVAGNTRMLTKTDNFPLTPLDKSAPYLQGGGNRAGQPGPLGTMNTAPSSAPGTTATSNMPFPGFDRLPPGVQARIQERMNNMTPEEREQMMNRFMNRQFEGRGRRRGGFGGFGGGFGGFGGGQ